MAKNAVDNSNNNDGEPKAAKASKVDRAALDWSRVSVAVKARRAELQFTQDDVAARLHDNGTKVNIETYRRMERGEKSYYRLPTLAAVSMALGWPPNTLYDIALGAEIPLSSVQFDRLREEVTRLADDVAVLHEAVGRLELAVQAAVTRPRSTQRPRPAKSQ